MNKPPICHQKIKLIDAYWIPAPAGIKGFGIKVLRKVRKYYIFMHSGPFVPPTKTNIKFDRYDYFDDIPNAVKQTIITNEGMESLENERLEMMHGATMWAGLVDGQVAHIKLIRYGKDFKRWFIDLDDNDIVLFRERTYPKYRGRSIQAAVTRHILYNLLQNGGRAYIDCNIHNISSIRGIFKSGFEKIATVKPITRKQALGVDHE
mgnify:CR=1 FL=1